MGEFADYIFDLMLDEEIIFHDSVVEYYESTIEYLMKETNSARDPLILGIRKYYKTYKKLSNKQKWRLAFYLAEKNEESNY